MTMTTGKRIAKGGLVLVLVLGIAVVSYHALEWALDRAIMSGMCGNTVLSESPSLSGQWKAVIWPKLWRYDKRNHQVSILHVADDLPNESGNVCAVGVFPKVEVQWLNDKVLIIRHHGGATIFPVTQTFEGIEIKYEVQGQAASNKRLQLAAR